MPKTKPTAETIRQQVMNEWIFVCQARNGRPTNNKDFGKAVHISESTAARRKNDYRKPHLTNFYGCMIATAFRSIQCYSISKLWYWLQMLDLQMPGIIIES